jgi:hypothetical protein
VVHDCVGGADVADAVAEERRGVIAGDAFGCKIGDFMSSRSFLI